MEYVEADLVRIAKRENNTKRNYLVVNPLQGKHVPVSPKKALELFSSLAESFRNEYSKERLLLVGFAETATAIGAQAAITLGTKYIHTTREIIPDVEYLFFSEEHSHAAEQKLVKDDIDAVVSETDRIVFIEDEVTTGNTILNIIKILEKLYPGKLRFSAASILNGMSEEHLKQYEDKGINLHYLVKTEHSAYSSKAEQFSGNGDYYDCITKENAEITGLGFDRLRIAGLMNTRRIVDAAEYENACESLWKQIQDSIGGVSGKSILVIGTEEFMFPALYVGSRLEEQNFVRCHSTTRSPIMASLEKDYPLRSRYELKSLYDKDRRTFIYNIEECDKVYILTDSLEGEEEGLGTLVNALSVHNKNITLIRWC